MPINRRTRPPGTAGVPPASSRQWAEGPAFLEGREVKWGFGGGRAKVGAYRNTVRFAPEVGSRVLRPLGAPASLPAHALRDQGGPAMGADGAGKDAGAPSES